MNSRFLLLVCHSVMETSLCKVNLPVQVSFVTNPYSKKTWLNAGVGLAF